MYCCFLAAGIGPPPVVSICVESLFDGWFCSFANRLCTLLHPIWGAMFNKETKWHCSKRSRFAFLFLSIKCCNGLRDVLDPHPLTLRSALMLRIINFLRLTLFSPAHHTILTLSKRSTHRRHKPTVLASQMRCWKSRVPIGYKVLVSFHLQTHW